MSSHSATDTTLLDADFIEQVHQFSLNVVHAGKGGRLAEQKTSARGQGLEFADFKPYVAGDDLRAIDWNIYRRLGRVFVRVFEEQQNLPVYLLLDLSSSMFVENPSRIAAAKKAAFALSAIALNQHASVTLIPFSEQLTLAHKPMSGRHQMMRMAEILTASSEQQKSSLAKVLSEFANYPLRQGLVVVVSDFFDNDGIEPVVTALQSIRHRLLLLQVTQPWDAEPQLHPLLTGDVRLQDSELATHIDVQITGSLVKQYQMAYQQFNSKIVQLAKSRGAGLFTLNASDAVLPQLTQFFADGGSQL
ncbi:DUF58 domain-containing protein [Shewanella sp.]|uniref:DUF58 domain-containing protein n=1 Tax=Shewanella sp. TaxID=50422 RepID=UPI003A96E9D3